MGFAVVGDVISKQVQFTPAEIGAFAREVGDTNPLHCDPGYAAATRFGGIIACGPHVLAHFFSVLASHYSTGMAMVGLESSFKLLAPAYPDTSLELTWRVVGVERKTRLSGEVVDLEGHVKDPDGTVVISATFKALVVSSL
jgi:acyl dehydratase